MAGFVRATRVVILNPDELDPAKQNVVTLRKWNAGQRQRVASLSTSQLDVVETQLAAAAGGQPKILIDMPKQRLEAVKVCIQSWTGPLFDGIPLTGENIEEMDPADIDQLADACDQLNQGLSEDEKKTSTSPMNGASSTATNGLSLVGTPT